MIGCFLGGFNWVLSIETDILYVFQLSFYDVSETSQRDLFYCFFLACAHKIRGVDCRLMNIGTDTTTSINIISEASEAFRGY